MFIHQYRYADGLLVHIHSSTYGPTYRPTLTSTPSAVLNPTAFTPIQTYRALTLKTFYYFIYITSYFNTLP